MSEQLVSEQSTLVLMVNDKSHCNMACEHCYLPYEGVRSPEDVLELVDELKSRFCIVIAGSETLTDLGYLDAYQSAGQNYILTNGLLLNKQPEIFEKLTEHGIEEIRISFHFGIQEDLHSVPRKIVENVIRESKERGFKVRVGVTITPDNFSNVCEMCDQVFEMGSDAIHFIKYFKSGSAVSCGVRLLTTEEKQEFFSLVDSARKKYDKSDLDIIIHGNFGPKEGSSKEYCPAGEKLFAIDPNGKLYGCPFLMEHPIGELRDDFEFEINKTLCNGKRDKCLTDL